MSIHLLKLFQFLIVLTPHYNILMVRTAFAALTTTVQYIRGSEAGLWEGLAAPRGEEAIIDNVEIPSSSMELEPYKENNKRIPQ